MSAFCSVSKKADRERVMCLAMESTGSTFPSFSPSALRAPPLDTVSLIYHLTVFDSSGPAKIFSTKMPPLIWPHWDSPSSFFTVPFHTDGDIPGRPDELSSLDFDLCSFCSCHLWKFPLISGNVHWVMLSLPQQGATPLLQGMRWKAGMYLPTAGFSPL